MKTVILKGHQQAELIEVPTPGAFENYAVIRLHSAPMCTEYRKFAKGDTCSDIGHEAAGEVIETSGITKVKKGDRVIVMPQFACGHCELCRQGDYIHCEHQDEPLKTAGLEYGTGAFAEYLIKPDWLLIPIPDDISYDEAAMACCALGPALGAGMAMGINAGDTVLITGLGPVGLGAVIYCTYLGARVLGTSQNDYRRSLAKQLGAELTFNPNTPDIQEKILEQTGGKGVDKVIECTGEALHQRLAFDSVKRKGQISFVGESSELRFDLSRDLLRKGLALHGIWHWNMNDTGAMIDAIRGSKQKISQLITHIFPLDKVEDAFRIQLSANCGKVILRP